MRKEKKTQRALDNLAKIIAAHNKTPVEVPTVAEVLDRPFNPSYEADAVLLMLEKPSRFILNKVCKWCGETFGTNYQAVGYCSDNCRRRKLEDYGLTWNPTKTPEERWGGVPPLIISPSTLRVLKQLLSLTSEHDYPQSEVEEEIPETSPVPQPETSRTQLDFGEVPSFGF